MATVGEIDVSVLMEDDVCRVVVTGELDMATSPVVHERLAEASGRVFIDCSGLTFLDSSGIAEFLMLTKRVESVTLVKPSQIVQDVIEALGLGEVLRVAE